MHTLHTKSFELFKYLVDTIITVKITYKPAIIIKAKINARKGFLR